MPPIHFNLVLHAKSQGGRSDSMYNCVHTKWKAQYLDNVHMPRWTVHNSNIIIAVVIIAILSLTCAIREPHGECPDCL